MKKIILLMNVGSPDAPNVKAVAKYLASFLNDKYVMDIPWLWRKLLVNLIIIPFRVKKSTRIYKMLWTQNGSPLVYYQAILVKKLQQIVSEEYLVLGAMRYGHPSLRETLESVEICENDEIILMPMFPQYTLPTTESASMHFLDLKKKLNIEASHRLVAPFGEHESYVKCFAARIRSYNPDNFDHIVFSFHGLPTHQVKKMGDMKNHQTCFGGLNVATNYPAVCRQTASLLAKELSLTLEQYSISFQSKMSKNWMKPFTDEVLLQLLSEGKKRILVAAPSFVADCLETTVEVGVEYKELFLSHGGECLELVDSLNDNDEWVKVLAEIIRMEK